MSRSPFRFAIPSLKLTAVAGAIVVLIGASATPATASSELAPSPVDDAGVGTVHVEGGTILESGPTSSDPPIDAEQLAAAGVAGNVVSIEQDANGGTFYIYDDGGWVLTPPAPGEVTGDVSVQSGWDAGTFCAGTFTQIQRINDELYWGGQNVCEGLPNSIYPHSLSITLRDGCTGPFCFQEEAGTRTSTDSRYNLVQTVGIFTDCANSDERRYDQIARPIVKGIEFGPIVDTENFVVACDWIGQIS